MINENRIFLKIEGKKEIAKFDNYRAEDHWSNYLTRIIMIKNV